MRKGFLAVTVLMASLAALAAEELKVAASVNKRSLRVGESVVLTLRLSGPGAAVPQPPLPPLSDLKLSGQYQTVESEGGERVFAYHYMLSPTRAGRLTVPDLSLRIGGSTRTVPGFTLEVETAPAPPPPPPGAPKAPPTVVPSPVEPAGEDLSLVGELSSRRAYLGQPVTYTLHLVTRRSVRNFEITDRPDFQGFRKVEVPQPKRPPTRQLVRGGVTYLDVTILRFTLFPIEEGALAIQPFEAVLRVESKEVIGQVNTVRLKGGATTLTTESLPAPPPGFGGAVGTFSLALVGAPPQRADLGQPFDLDFRVEGTGFLPEAPLRWGESPFFTVYPATSQDDSAFDHGAFRVRRQVRLSLLPRLPGDAPLPRATLVYFDPAAGRYETREVPPGRVEVQGGTAGKESALALSPLIASPRTGGRRGEARVGAAFFALLGAPFLLSALLAGGLWLYRTRFAAPEKVRARALVHQAHRQLHLARKAMDVRHAATFHGHLLKALQAALDLRTGRATAGLTRPAVKEALKEAGAGEEEVSRLLRMLDQMEGAEFAGESVSKRDLQGRLDAVKRYLAEVGRG